jgi:hypothetical protein
MVTQSLAARKSRVMLTRNVSVMDSPSAREFDVDVDE